MASENIFRIMAVTTLANGSMVKSMERVKFIILEGI
jgi:hypothetical protein